MPKIDLTNAELPEALPAATYECSIEEMEYVAESSASGEPYAKFTFVVDEGEYEGRKVFWNRSLQPKNLGYFKKALINCGADPEDIAGEFDFDEIAEDIKDNSVRVVVGVRDYEGEQTNEVKRVLKAE